MESFLKILETKSNDELLKMVYEYDQWSPEMLASVESELTKRNILPNDINARKQELTEEEDNKLVEGKSASAIGLVVGWITALGLLGIFIGYNYKFSKVSNKYSGKQYFKYNESSRKNGSYLFYTSLILISVEIFYGVFKEYFI